MDLLPIRPAFKYLINNFPDDLVGVEIGTWSGEYAITMTEACKRLKIYTVDNNPQSEIYKNIYPYPRIEFIQGDSVEVAKQFPDKHFDFVYIDGGHDYENCFNDIKAWFPKLKDKGVFGGHDWYFDSVKKAVFDSINNGTLKNGVIIESEPEYGPEYAGGLSDWYFVYGGK